MADSAKENTSEFNEGKKDEDDEVGGTAIQQPTDQADTKNDEVMEDKIEEKNENTNNKNEQEAKTTKTDDTNKENQKDIVNKDDKKKAAVDLKSLKPTFNPRTKTTLPDILTEYGLEDETKQQTKEKPKKKKKRKTDQEEADDDEANKRKTKEDKFRQAFGDSRQSDTYYMEYLDFLEKKVKEERLKAQKQKEEEAKRALALAQEETPPVAEMVVPPVVEEKQKRYNIRKLERVELKHDDTFIRGLHKTDLARIISLQDKLARQGKLKNQAAVDLFWEDIRKPDVFFSHFKVKMNTESAHSAPPERSHDNASATATFTRQPEMAPRMLSNISEASKAEKEPWAITQKFASTHGDRTPSPAKSRKNSNQLAKEAAFTLEQRCPKLEMPPLSCFSLKLGEKPPDPEEIQRRIELKLREKNRKKFQRKLNKMYQMAMTHSAAATRILSNHTDLLSIVEGAALRDVRDFCCEKGSREHTQLSVFEEPYTIEDYYREMADPSRAIEVHPDMEVGGFEPSPPDSRHTSAGSAGSRTKTPASRPTSMTRQGKKITLEKIEAPPPLPLCFDEVLVKEKTMEPKCLSSNWTNYMHAGHSVFSKS